MFTRLLPWLSLTLLASLPASAASQRTDQDALTLLTACGNAVERYTAIHFANPGVRTCQDPKLKLKQASGLIEADKTKLDTRLTTQINFAKGVGSFKINVKSASGQWLTYSKYDVAPRQSVSYIYIGKEATSQNTAEAEAVELLLTCEHALLLSASVAFSTEHFPSVRTCHDPRLMLKSASGPDSKGIGSTKLITEVQAEENDWVINVQSRSGTWFSLTQRQGDLFTRQPSLLLKGKAQL